MPKPKTTTLAKLTRPRLHNAVARERLFAKLDCAREQRPALCVAGPPGTRHDASFRTLLKIKSLLILV